MPTRGDDDRAEEQERRILERSIEQQRIDEMRALATRIGNLSDDFIRYEERQITMARDVTEIKTRQEHQAKKQDENFIRRSDFDPNEVTMLKITVAKLEQDIRPMYKLFWATVASLVAAVAGIVWTAVSKSGGSTPGVH